ncbi:efflux RND transporter periplasmic adaptor subunit [Novosphingobium resinovorum]|uniref:efflux RND transporter periplasmic adaptor subunit n=1 Tax=Novosphingobium resinovorum TaxID=158500 RepID=UPI002ED09CE0|nr:efflux RND transporter periplasmic adaptor subunit [Novosphingobium resinovorum]
MPETNADPDIVSEHRSLSPRARRISWIVVIVVIVLALALIFGLATGGKSGGAGGPGGPGGRGRGGPASTVGTAQATAMDVPVTIEALGTVTPAATVTVRPQVAGAIQEILFREGQIVRKGQVLAVIDPRAYRAQLVQAQGALQRDQAQLQVARLTLRRYQVLLGQDSIARQDVDTQAATVRQLEGTVTVDRGAVQAAEVNLGFTRVISPVNGRVGLRTVDVGNYVSAGESGGIVTITTLSPIDVQFTVPQDRIPSIEKRIAQGASLSATAKDQTRTNVLGQGTFLTLNNVVSTTTGTVSAKARFANADNALYPSQFVNLTLDVDMIRGAVTVPGTAAREGTSGSYVWLLKSDNTVEQRKVVTGPGYNDRVVITSGLKLGETVVTEGGDRLTAGGKVQTAATAAKASGKSSDAKRR